jgi:antirestriction protein ArdC
MTTPETTTQQRQKREIDWRRLIEVALETPGSVGDVYNRFYDYSFLNQMFLRMQGVSEPVATYKRWQSLGRQVLRGSKAYAIVRPIVIEKKNDDGDIEDKLLRFKPVNCLFTVSQTEGDDLPPAETPGWELDLALKTLDVRQMSYELIDGNTQGYSYKREFAINPVAAEPTHTMFHELGHIVLGHTAPDAKSQQEYAQHRGTKEFQAEATAYLTLNELEVLTPDSAAHSRGYIQGWLRNERPPDVTIRQVFAATDTILKAGRAAPNLSGGPDV